MHNNHILHHDAIIKSNNEQTFTRYRHSGHTEGFQKFQKHAAKVYEVVLFDV